MLKKSLMKKSLIFGAAALFLTALITLTGCAQATDSEKTSSGGGGWNSLYGTIDAFTVQDVINKAIDQRVAIYLEDGLTITAISDLRNTIDFKTATVRINGQVAVDSNIVINGAHAAIQGDGSLQLGIVNSGQVYISQHGAPLGNIGSPNVVDYVTNISEPTETAEKIAVLNYTMGPLARNDYSTGTPVPVRAGIATVYVLEKLIIPVDATIDASLGIVALGTVDLTGTPPKGIAVSLGTSATVTSSAGTLELNLPSTATILPTINVQSGKPIVINGAADGLSIYRVEGTEPLQISADFTGNVQVAGGTGNVRFTGAQSGAVFGIDSTGTVTFDKAVTLRERSSIKGDAVFKADVTLDGNSSYGVKFLGDITLWHGPVGAGNTLTISNGPVILSKDTTVYVGGDPYTAGGAAAVVEPAAMLKAVTDVTLTTTTGGTTLTSPIAKYDGGKAEAAAKNLILGAQGLTIAAGTLEVVNGGSFTLNDKAVTLTKDTTRATSAYLAVADGGTVALAAGGNSAVAIGDNVDITYVAANGNAATLKAAGGTVTFGYDEITGTDAALNVAGAALITVPANTSAVAEKSLRVSGVNLNLATAGSLIIKNNSSGYPGSTVVLLNKGQITVDVKTPFANSLKALNDGTTEVTFAGIGAAALGANAKEENAALVSLAAPETGTVTITGIGTAATDFTFAKGKVKFVK